MRIIQILNETFIVQDNSGLSVVELKKNQATLIHRINGYDNTGIFIQVTEGLFVEKN
jgi:hypothetical protein